jgi:hypothetical protein
VDLLDLLGELVCQMAQMQLGAVNNNVLLCSQL